MVDNVSSELEVWESFGLVSMSSAAISAVTRVRCVSEPTSRLSRFAFFPVDACSEARRLW